MICEVLARQVVSGILPDFFHIICLHFFELFLSIRSQITAVTLALA